MRSLSEYFIKYVLSDPAKELAEAYDFLAYKQISVTPDYITALRHRMQFPANFAPLDPSHAPSMEFLHKERIWSMWYPDAAVHEASKIFDSPAIRGVVCAGILGGYKSSAIMSMTQSLYGHAFLLEAVQEFRHFFFNIELLSQDELASFLARPDQDGVYRDALKATVKTLKNHPAGEHLAMYKLGILPEKLESLEMLKTMRDLAYVNYLEADATVPQCRNKSEMFKNYGGAFLLFERQVREVEEASHDVLREFAAFVRLRTEGNEHRAIAELTAGPEVLNGDDA